MSKRLLAWIPVVAIIGLLPAPAQAQQGGGPRPLATRTELDSMARKLSGEAGQFARTRLEQGDFQPGDRILLHVDRQPALSDTFDVNQDRVLMLPIAGPVPLKGVLLSEIEPYLTEQLRQYLKYPQVYARALIQLSVQGAVARPGFYFVPPDGNLSDAIRAAGGTTRDARLSKAALQRDGKPLWKGGDLQRALAAGRTLDQANLHRGDELLVPGRLGEGVSDRLRFLWLIVSLTGGIYGLTRVL